LGGENRATRMIETENHQKKSGGERDKIPSGSCGNKGAAEPFTIKRGLESKLTRKLNLHQKKSGQQERII